MAGNDRDTGHVALSPTRLKLMAALSMLIDHAAGSLVDWYLRFAPHCPEARLLSDMSLVAHCVGRLSFPLFVFLLVEGFRHTRGRRRYLTRLATLAVVSEAPFDLAFLLWRADLDNGVWWRPEHQNTLFTLALGLAVIWAVDTLRPRGGERRSERAARTAACLAVVTAGCLVGLLMQVDYSWQGVLSVVLTYLARAHLPQWTVPIATTIPLAVFSPYELIALLDIPLVGLYDSSAGVSRNRWLFYAFYPGHLLALGILRVLLVLPR